MRNWINVIADLILIVIIVTILWFILEMYATVVDIPMDERGSIYIGGDDADN